MPSFPFQEQDIAVIYGTKNDPEISVLRRRLSIDILARLEPVGLRTRIYLDEPRGQADAEELTVNTHGVISPSLPGAHPSWSMLTADCPGLIAIDTARKTCGLLHAGWLQLYFNAPKRFFRLWQSSYPFGHADMRLLISPCICGGCFTLSGWKGAIRVALFSLSRWKKFLVRTNGVYSLDLRNLLIHQLRLQGFSDDQITASSECTFENPHLSSHRRERGFKLSSNSIIVRRG